MHFKCAHNRSRGGKHSHRLAYTHCSSYLYADDAAAAAATDVAKYNIQSIFEVNQRHHTDIFDVRQEY